MNRSAELGDRLKKYYARHSIYIDMAAKFVLALVSFIWIRTELNFNAFLSNFFVLLVMAILSTVMPVIAIPIFDAILIVGQAFSVGIDAGAVALALYLVLLIMFLRFVSEEAWETAAMPVLMAAGLPLLLPLLCGLKRRAASVFAVCSGIVIYHFVKAVSDGADGLSKLEVSDYAERLDIIVGGTFGTAFIIHLIGCAAALIVVYAVRNLAVNHAFLLSVLLGTAVYVILTVIGAAVLGDMSGTGTGIAGAAVAMVIALLFLAADTPLDYGKCENLRFEDDDYYYYVKAVPKIASVEPAAAEEEPAGEGDAAAGPDLENVDFEQKLEDSLKNL